MKEEKWYQILVRFLWQYRKTGMMFLVYCLIFLAIFSLYNLELEAVMYAAGLCCLLTAVLLAGRFRNYLMEHRERRRILENVEILLDELPNPATLAEEDYQEMLRKLSSIFSENLNGWQNERRESMDYYTTWVHQIKTPISVMRMRLQGEDTEEHRELLAELFRVEQYVEMALNWMRLGSDSTDFLFREYELDSIVRQAIRKYAPQFIRRRIGIKYEPADVKVLTDEKWLLFIIEQILSNAVKYTPQGSVTIRVTPEKVLEIADTGIGIAPEDVPRIFEKGFTGYNGRTDKKSTGLGLYLCRLTAEKLSHKISVESAVGVGTTVSIDLHSDTLWVE
ncbi:MAG: HAMP domain-containing histidine kinase [Lachnospiraceae bacterium]|nr:sensor histidine kinase [uncultured Acetatifactor sp.]MCI8541875.1 HAMP domain-containing histidine kinase [Lachnospiraceae bacterium]